MRWIITIFLLFISISSYAAIFKCLKNDGSIYYYDRDCFHADKSVAMTKRDLALMRFELQQKQEDIRKQQRQQLRQELAAEKSRMAEQRQRSHLQSKCAAIKIQIDQLNKRYKHGYTVKQGQAFNRKLAECNTKQRLYCKNE